MKKMLLTGIAVTAMMAAAAQADTYVVSMKGPAAGNPYWAQFEEGAKEKGKELGVEVLTVAPPSETDIQAQISQIEDLIAQKVDGIALAPTDPATPYAQANPGRFHRIDLSDGVCTPDFCPAIVGNIIVYKDWHHLSATYVRSLTSELSRQMAAAVPWTGPVLP